MSDLLLISMPGNDLLGGNLARATGAEIGSLEHRRFPDGESYLRYKTSPRNRDVGILCTLDRPDDKVLGLLFASSTARDLGARSVGLVCPYLAYMRQDKRFQSGEAVTSTQFGAILSRHFDWLVTVDPHLHRRSSLADIFSIQTATAHAAPLIAGWIRQFVDQPLLIGPDAESEQWVAAVADQAGAPSTILTKVRHGDRDVEVSVPKLDRLAGHTPVLVDDIVSTARTMVSALEHLSRADTRPAVCIAVHGVFAGEAYDELKTAGASRIITCNTIPHESNAIDVSDILRDAIMQAVETHNS